MSGEKRVGKQTVKLKNPVYIRAFASVAGKKEGDGPCGTCYDITSDDTTFGEKSWEKSESAMQKLAFSEVLKKSGAKADSIEYLCSGDLLNQCVGSAFGLRDACVPFLGLYGACSTMSEGMCIASMLIDGGFATRAVAMTSSHFASAERQYRLPLEYGGQRAPSAQWTVTGSGAVLLDASCANAALGGSCAYISHVTTGKIIDMGITDASNMGAAMAPAAYETLKALFSDSGTSPGDYDLILTGDLGSVGKSLVRQLFADDGVELGAAYNDCGCIVYDAERQDVHAGGSGCGCSAITLCGPILRGMASGQWKKIIFAGTGALLSPVSSMQGESIPSICHAVIIQNS